MMVFTSGGAQPLLTATLLDGILRPEYLGHGVRSFGMNLVRVSSFVGTLLAACGCTRAPSSSTAPTSTPLVIETLSAPREGTIHGADCVTLRSREDGPSTRICGDEKSEDLEQTLVPYFYEQHAHPTDATTAVIIGWTSLGSGMQTSHAWIVRLEDGASPKVIERLAWVSTRSRAGFAIESTADALKVGIPWTFDEPVRDDWWLDIGDRRLDLDAVKRLTFVISKGPLHAPLRPSPRAPWPAGTRVAWFDVTARGFHGP